MKVKEEVGCRRGGKTFINEWAGTDFASSIRAAENRTNLKINCCKVICGAPRTLQGYGVEQKRIEIKCPKI